MNKFFWGLVLLCAGCASSGGDRLDPYAKYSEKRQELTAIDRVRVGMEQARVRELMNDHLVIGYEKNGTGTFEAIKVAQPYQTSRQVTDTGIYDIHFYVTKIHKADGIISQEELTPLIFQERKLVGIGYEVLDNLGVR